MPEPLKVKPAWLRSTGLVSVGFWEPLYFLKYRGGQSTELEAEYERAHSDESLDALAAAGINLVWIHYFKGFGLEFEAEEMERTADYIRRAHERGIKVAAYVTLGSLTPETLLSEEPEAQNWLQINQDGQPPSCQTSYQCFRVRPCYNCEGYLRYMERVCGAAIEAGSDMIHFDNIGFNAEPDTCHCPVCVAAFREMLREEYGPQDEDTRAAGVARFGHNSFTHLRPPLFNRWNQAVQQRHVQVPHQQEWVRFKVLSLTRCIERLSKFIQRKNPECAVEANLFKAHGENTGYLHGIDYNAQLPHLDYAFSEEPHRTGTFNELGAAITRTRTFKTARAFDVALQTYHHGAGAEYELNLAENLAFNPKGLGHFGHPLRGFWAPGESLNAERDENARLAKAYIEFYRRHREELFLQTRSLARIAVFRDTPSLTWNSLETHLSQLNVEQTLIERNVPFDLLFATQLPELERYAAVVLANAECLSDEICARLKTYVERGGGLLLTEQTAQYDAWRRRRPRSALAELFGPAWPSAVHVQYGDGRVAYLPELAHAAQPAASPDVWYVFNKYWASVGNAEALLGALRHVAGAPPWTVQAQAGRPLAEAVAVPNGSRVVHVLNLDPQQTLRGLEVTLACEAAPTEVLPLSPLRSFDALPFEYDADARLVRFRMEESPRYLAFRVR